MRSLGRAGGINAQSLGREVQRLLEERERARRERLVATLPPATKAAAKDVAARLEDAILNHMAEEHDLLRSAAAKKVVDLRDDLSCQRAQIRELLSQVDEKDGIIAQLEGAKHELERRLEAATAEIALLNERIAEGKKEEDLRAQMLALMRDTLAQHAPAAA